MIPVIRNGYEFSPILMVRLLIKSDFGNRNSLAESHFYSGIVDLSSILVTGVVKLSPILIAE